MATIVHFEGANSAVNLDHIISFYKESEHENSPGWAVFRILFTPIHGNTGGWEFKTKEYRDIVFTEIVNTKTSKVFPAEGSNSDETKAW